MRTIIKWQRVLIFCQSGEISSNLVTLPISAMKRFKKQGTSSVTLNVARVVKYSTLLFVHFHSFPTIYVPRRKMSRLQQDSKSGRSSRLTKTTALCAANARSRAWINGATVNHFYQLFILQISICKCIKLLPTWMTAAVAM